MSHVRVTIDQRVVAGSPSLPDMVSVDLRELEDVEPLTVPALDAIRLRDDADDAEKVGMVCDGALDVIVDRNDAVRAVLRGLRARLESPVFSGESVLVRRGHAPE